MDYKPSQLTAYWLGTLSPAEQEQIEKDYFADDIFFHQLTDAKDQLIKAYLQHQLSQAERRQFEGNFLTHPRRSFEVALTETALSAHEIRPSSEKNFLSGWWTKFFPSGGLNDWLVVYPALATCVLLVGLIGIGVMWRQAKTPAASLIASSPVASAERGGVRVLQLGTKYRGDAAAQTPTLHKSAVTTTVTLQFDVSEIEAFFQFTLRVSPKNQPEKILHQQSGLPAPVTGPDRIVTAVLPLAQLPPDEYEVGLFGEEKSGTAFPLRHYYFNVQ